MIYSMHDTEHRWEDKSCGRTACSRLADESRCNLMSGWFYCKHCFNLIEEVDPSAGFMVINPVPMKLRPLAKDLEEMLSESIEAVKEEYRDGTTETT